MELLFGAEKCYKLYLSDNFNDFNKDLKVAKFKFSGGEPHIKISSSNNEIHFPTNFRDSTIRIYHTIKSFDDLGILYMTIDALRNMGVWKLSLFLPYFPGARQDRRAPGVCEPLSVKVYADLINALKLEEVIIFDSHSDVASALINNCVSLTNEKFFFEALPEETDFLIVSPDAGAAKKTERVSLYIKSLGSDKDYQGLPDILYFRKHRDMKTGELSGFYTDKIDLKGIDCVLVDDICDGGRTFIEIAKVLKEQNAGNLHLIVSHGIFSNGFRELLKYFKTITTSNSWANEYCYWAKDAGSSPAPGIQLRIIDIIKLYNL